MVLSWLSSGSTDVGELIAKKSYARATKLIRAKLEKDPQNVSLGLQLADVLQLDGQRAEAVTILLGLADGYARIGLLAKAIALFKKVQRIDPEREASIDRKIAELGKERDGETFRRIALREALQAKSRLAGVPARVSGGPKATLGPEPPITSPESSPEADSECAEFDLSSVEEPEPQTVRAETALERTPLFSDFSGDELVEVIRGLRLLTFEPGDVVVGEGEPADSLFVLTTGSVKAFCKDPRGQYRKAREMNEGSFFGEVSILTGTPRTATITAATHVELLELDTSTLESIAERHPRVLTVLRDFCEARAGSLEEIRIRMGRTGPPPAPDEPTPPGKPEDG